MRLARRHRVDNLAMAMFADHIDQRRGASARLCEEFPAVVRDHPFRSMAQAPTIDLVVGHNKTNTSPILPTVPVARRPAEEEGAAKHH